MLKFFSTGCLGSLETFLCCLLRVIMKSFQFIKEYQAREPSYSALLTRNDDSISTENDALNLFLESLWKAIDQVCVPAVMLNYESVENPAVFTNFFEILYLSVSEESTCREIFARKLASGSFVRMSLEIKEKFCRDADGRDLTEAIAKFLPELCFALGNATEKTQLGERLKTGNIGCIHSASACLNLLAQSSGRQDTHEIIDESLFSTQCLCIELLYVSIVYGDDIVPVQELAMALHKYLVLHPDVSILPRVSLRHFMFLWITSCNRLRSQPLPAKAIESINVSQEILEKSLMNFKTEEFEAIYVHDVLFVSWIFSCECLAHTFGRQVLICFMETEETRDTTSEKALHQLLTSNLQSIRAFLSLVDFDEEAIVNHVVTVMEALITGVSDSDAESSVTMKIPRLNSLGTQITNIFHKLFLGHKTSPLQEHTITAMLKIMTAVQMKFLAFDIKLLYHVINLLTSTKGCQSFTVAAINYLNVTIAWDLDRDNQRVAAVLLSNKTFCEFIQEILDSKLVNDPVQRNISKDDSDLLASVLVLISSLAISQPQVHKDGHGPFKVSKRCMVDLANERRNILGISSLVFWDAFFRTSVGRSGKPLVVLVGRNQGKEDLLELSEVDRQVLLVYLQNSLVHDSETVRQCAIKCLGSFLSYVPDASPFASNPWNRIVLESQLTVLSFNVITSSLVVFCSLILQHYPGSHQFTDVLQNTVKSVVDRIPNIPCTEQDLSWHCIGLLVQLLKSIDNIMSQTQKGAVANWLAMFRESLGFIEKQSGGSDEDLKFYKLDSVIFAKDLLKVKPLKDLELLAKVHVLLEGVSDKEDEEPTNRIPSSGNN